VSALIDISIESPRWADFPAAEQTVRGAIRAALVEAEADGAEVSVVLADDARIRELNRSWLGKDKATNVLSFPSPDGPGGEPRFLGDIVLAFETIEREAGTEGKPLAHHVAHLAVHGALHLLGYDHERESEAEKMELRERIILAQLGIADPYAPAEERRTETA
jgi:probable rRNA maturation factor